MIIFSSLSLFLYLNSNLNSIFKSLISLSYFMYPINMIPSAYFLSLFTIFGIKLYLVSNMPLDGNTSSVSLLCITNV